MHKLICSKNMEAAITHKNDELSQGHLRIKEQVACLISSYHQPPTPSLTCPLPLTRYPHFFFFNGKEKIQTSSKSVSHVRFSIDCLFNIIFKIILEIQMVSQKFHSITSIR